MKIDEQLANAFSKVSENYTVTMCLNGFVVELSGQDSRGDWVSHRLIMNKLEELNIVVHDLNYIPRC